MKAGGAGFALFAKSQPDTPGKLVAHAYSYEHLELASYELLLRVAERAGDQQTAEIARTIRDEECAMARAPGRLVRHRGRPPRCRRSSATTSSRSSAPTWPTRTRSRTRRSACSSAPPTIGGDERMTSLYAEHLDETMRPAGDGQGAAAAPTAAARRASRTPR